LRRGANRCRDFCIFHLQAPEQFRLFLALSIPDKVKSAIESAQSEMRRIVPDRSVRWTRREQYHLTLRFLGNVSASQVNPLIDVIRAACEPFAPLRLVAAQMGFFPDRRAPRVLWVGVKDLESRLISLWSVLQSVTQPFAGEPAETDFTGHVTLARLNRLPRVQTEDLAETAGKFENSIFGKWTAEQVELMRSELLPQGARHSLLAALPVSGNEPNREQLS
jgi:2'-5' RNA ligase